ncbi:Rho-GTPase-activating protein 8 [Venturia inaequalis]|nr:Rho-GTPase-activating protein 8 [Venturia inaequalis]
MEGQLNNSTLREAEAETETRRLQKINTMLEKFKAREELRAEEMKTVVGLEKEPA